MRELSFGREIEYLEVQFYLELFYGRVDPLRKT